MNDSRIAAALWLLSIIAYIVIAAQHEVQILSNIIGRGSAIFLFITLPE